MKKPVLVVMAAGMGSRYGGLKQIDPVGPDGEVILDYSVYDALCAGFEKVIFIIRKDIEEEFKNSVSSRFSDKIEVSHVFQRLDDLPEGFEPPPGREKMWGTMHAVLSARNEIDGPFAVINADDYYGREAFCLLYNFLSEEKTDTKEHYAMVGYRLSNTLSENGSVSRGVCNADENNMLISTTERTRIEKMPTGPAYSEDAGQSWVPIPGDTLVSMNCWGFGSGFIKKAWEIFPEALNGIMEKYPQKGEYYLPYAVNKLLASGKADVKVIPSTAKWYGITYKEDKEKVAEALSGMHLEGIYPTPLWDR